MKEDIKNEILRDYDTKKEIYKTCEKKIQIILEDIFKTKDNEKISQIAIRVKERESLSEKIDIKQKYKKLGDITDILGARIIVYFEDNIKEIEETIKEEFTIDEENSINKLKTDSPDIFKYKSLHLVCGLKNNWFSVPGHDCFRNIKFEIQIRTIFQHGWAQNEHGLGYRNMQLSGEYRRDINRLSALLELADKEFLRIRNSIHEYKNNVGKKIEKTPEDVLIDKISITSFILNNKTVCDMDKKIAGDEEVKYKRDQKTIYIDTVLPVLKHFKIKTIKELEDCLLKHKKNIYELSRLFSVTKINNKNVIAGTSIAYLSWCLIGSKSKSVNEVREELNILNIDFLELGIEDKIFKSCHKGRQ